MISTDTSDHQILIEYFKYIITKYTSKKMTNRRSFTTQHFDRYVFCLNVIMAEKYIPIVDLNRKIKDVLEKGIGYEIDKKTVRRIVDHLSFEKLVKIQQIKTQITYEGSDKLDKDEYDSDDQIFKYQEILQEK